MDGSEADIINASPELDPPDAFPDVSEPVPRHGKGEDTTST